MSTIGRGAERVGGGLEVGGSRGGAEVEVDAVGSDVGGSEGEDEEATRCCTAPRKTSTIFSIGSERKASISASVHGWLAHTF